MFGIISRRFFHTSRITMATTADLSKLRKSTGYTVSNCKKALDMFPNDIIKAEEWLHGQAKSKGWSKMKQIQNRTATQGLIGVYSKHNIGVIVEVNCETDFVARNLDFQQFVENVISGCVTHASSLPVDGDVKKVVLESDQLHMLKYEESTIGDLIATAITKFSEKTVAKRAVCLKVNNEVLLSSLTHPAAMCPKLNGASLGKYGTLLAYKKKPESSENHADIGTNICQHVIGMNPSSIGQLSDADIDKFMKKENTKDISQTTVATVEQNINTETSEESVESQDDDEVASDDDDALKNTEETRLVHQPYLLDSNVTVGETLYKSGIEIVDFERFECGESEQQQEVAEAVANA